MNLLKNSDILFAPGHMLPKFQPLPTAVLDRQSSVGLDTPSWPCDDLSVGVVLVYGVGGGGRSGH